MTPRFPSSLATRWPAALAGMVALLIASCSLPVNEEPRLLNPDDYSDVVYGLETTSTTVAPEGEGRPIRLFFINEDGLSWVRRNLLETKIPDILDALQQGPTPEELEVDPTLKNELPAGLNPVARPRAQQEQILIVDVDDAANLRNLPSDNQALAESVFSQLVCTLTSLNLNVPITGVEFYDSSGPIQLFDANRSPIDGPARASDFNDCLTPAELAQLEQDLDTTSTTEG